MDDPARWSMSTATESADSGLPEQSRLSSSLAVSCGAAAGAPEPPVFIDPPQIWRKAPEACHAPLALRPGPPDKIMQGRRPRGPLSRSFSYAFPKDPLAAPAPIGSNSAAALRVRAFASMRLDNVHERKTRSVARRGRSAMERERPLDEDHSPQVDPEVWSEISDDPLAAAARRPTLAQRARTMSRSVKRIVGRVAFTRSRRRLDRDAFR